MAKTKEVKYTLIPRTFEDGAPMIDRLQASEMYALMARLIEEHHEELTNATIALAWCTSWNADPDGRVTIGKCRKATDLDRELAAFDFVILLSRDFWRGANDTQRTALLDHELCHATAKLDEHGEQVYDERGRQVWRMRKHDLEEFASIAERYGCYKRDLESFAAALTRGKQLRLELDGAALVAEMDRTLVAGVEGNLDPALFAARDLLARGAQPVGPITEMLRRNSGITSVEFTTSGNGRRRGTRITKDKVEKVDRPEAGR